MRLKLTIFILFSGTEHQTNQHLSCTYVADIREKNPTYANLIIVAIARPITIVFEDINLDIPEGTNINVPTITVNTHQYSHLHIKCI